MDQGKPAGQNPCQWHAMPTWIRALYLGSGKCILIVQKGVCIEEEWCFRHHSPESDSPQANQWRLQQWDISTAYRALTATDLQSCGLVWRLVFECQVCVALHCTLLHSSLPIVRSRCSLQFSSGSSSLCCRPAATASAPSYTRGHGRCKWFVEVSLVHSVLLNLLGVGETLECRGV
jgi:hypothetical protein